MQIKIFVLINIAWKICATFSFKWMLKYFGILYNSKICKTPTLTTISMLAAVHIIIQVVRH